MRTLDSKYFGSVTLARGDDDTYVKRDVTLGGHTAERSLFLGAGLGAARIEAVRMLLDELETLDTHARGALRRELDADAEGTVAEYLQFHLDELGPDVMVNVLRGDPATPTALLEHVELCGVSAHTRLEGFVLVLDYSPGRAHTDQLLAVSFDTAGTLTGITHES